MHTLTIKDLQGRMLWLAAGIVLITGVAVAAAVLLPMRAEMRAAADQHLRHSLEVKRMAADQLLSRLTDISRQIISRTQIRKRLIAFNKGEVTLENVRDFSVPRLGDALNESGEALGMVRFDRENRPVALVGQAPPETLWTYPEADRSPALSGPFEVDGRLVAVVATAIFDKKGTRHGTDVVMFHLDNLVPVLTDTAQEVRPGRDSILADREAPDPRFFGVAVGTGAMGFVSPPLDRAALARMEPDDAGVTLASSPDGVERAMASTVLSAVPWRLVEMETTDTLYADVRATLGRVVAILAFLISVGVLAAMWFLRSLTGQVLVAAGDLESEVAERRAAEEEIRLKNRELEQSNAELESFAYVASHDLREPLRNVTSFATLLSRRMEGRATDEDREFLTIITDGAMRMDNLVRDLLDFSRIGHQRDPMIALPLGAVLDASRLQLRTQLEECGAELEVPASLPIVLGDAQELERVFVNLIGNALKYRSPDRRPKIVLDYAEKDGTWRFCCHDNGIGIEPGHGYEEKIFSLFQRLHQRNEHGGGTGVGLAICRKIIERHGGRIWAESRGIDQGTEFVFTLPILS